MPVDNYVDNDNWPATWSLCRLQGQLLQADGSAATGSIWLKPVPTAVYTDSHIVLPRSIEVELDDNGSFDQYVPATDDPDINPTEWNYRVTERVSNGRTYYINAPGGTTLNLADAAPVPSSPGDAVVVGPPGPTVVSTDANNVAEIGTDGFLFVPPIAGITDHGDLDGLADDDHPQYLNVARGDARYFTEAEVTASLATKSNTGHAHAGADITSGTVPIARIPTGQTGSTVPLGNDARFTDARTPTNHAASHGFAAADPLSLDAAQIESGILDAALMPFGTAADTVAEGDHVHPIDDITATGTPSDTTYLRGDGSWAVPAGGGGGVTDHGALTGLADDDHPQYHNDTRGDARYFTQAQVGTEIADALDAHAHVHRFAQRDYGITTGTNQFTEIQAAINDIGRNGTLWFEEGEYQVNDELVLEHAGFNMRAVNGTFVRITQTDATKSLIKLVPDADYDFAINTGTTIEGFRLVGQGDGTATGQAIYTATSGSTYLATRVKLKGLHIQGFEVGIRMHRADNLRAEDVFFSGCGTGWYSSGNANSIHLMNVGCTTISDYGFRFADGQGVTFHPGDCISSTKMVLVENGAHVSMFGGNFESCTGDAGTGAFIEVADGGELLALGQRFLKGTPDVNRFLVGATGVLTVGLQSHSGFTNEHIRKVSSTAHVVVLDHQRTSGGQRVLIDDAGTIANVPGSLWPIRGETSIPAAGADRRNVMVAQINRDATNGPDALYWYMADKTSGSYVYTRRTLSAIMTGTTAPEGAVSAPQGTIYIDTDGGVGNTLFIKEDGSTGNTGWRSLGYHDHDNVYYTETEVNTLLAGKADDADITALDTRVDDLEAMAGIRAVQGTTPSTTGWAVNDLWLDTSTE